MTTTRRETHVHTPPDPRYLVEIPPRLPRIAALLTGVAVLTLIVALVAIVTGIGLSGAPEPAQLRCDIEIQCLPTPPEFTTPK